MANTDGENHAWSYRPVGWSGVISKGKPLLINLRQVQKPYARVIPRLADTVEHLSGRRQ